MLRAATPIVENVQSAGRSVLTRAAGEVQGVAGWVIREWRAAIWSCRDGYDKGFRAYLELRHPRGQKDSRR